MGKPTGKSFGITYTPRRVPAVGCSYTLSCDFRILAPSMILHAENPSIFLAFCCSWIDEKARSSACSVFVSFSNQWCRWERCFLFLSMFSSTEQSQIYQCKLTKSPIPIPNSNSSPRSHTKWTLFTGFSMFLYRLSYLLPLDWEEWSDSAEQKTKCFGALDEMQHGIKVVAG